MLSALSPLLITGLNLYLPVLERTLCPTSCSLHFFPPEVFRSISFEALTAPTPIPSQGLNFNHSIFFTDFYDKQPGVSNAFPKYVRLSLEALCVPLLQDAQSHPHPSCMTFPASHWFLSGGRHISSLPQIHKHLGASVHHLRLNLGHAGC